MRKLLYILLFCSLQSAATNYYIKNGGSDAANGLSDATAWATLSKIGSSSASPGDTFFLKYGSSWEESFSLPNDGASGNPIVIAGYGTGAKPIVSGFTTLTSWTNVSGDLYEKVISGGNATLNVVLLNSTYYNKGRYPKLSAANEGWLKFQSHSGNSSITSNAISGFPNFVGGEVVIRKNDFRLDKNIVTSQNSTTVGYTQIGESNGDPTNNYGFFFQNDPDACTDLGEWAYDGVSTKITMDFSGTTPGSNTIQVSTIENLVNIANRDYISFFDIVFEGANKNVFYATTTTNINIQRCDFNNIGQAVFYNNNYQSVDKVNIEYCTFNNILNTGIHYAQGSRLTVNHCTANYIGYHRGAGELVSADVTGLFTAYPGLKFTARYNDVFDCGKNAITFFGDSSTIEYNYISRFSWNVSDGGGIYCWGGNNTMLNGGHEINNNIVTYGIGEALGTGNTTLKRAFGIYLDDNTVKANVRNNTMAFCGETNFYIHNSRYITAENNINYKGGEYGLQWTDDGGYGGISNLNYQNNIYFQKSPAPYIVSLTDVTLISSSWGTIDNNKYIYCNNDAIAGYILHTAFITGQYADFKTRTGKDVNSTNTTPAWFTGSNDSLFINPTNATVNVSSAYKWRDLDGNYYDGTIPLTAYQGMILANVGAATVPPAGAKKIVIGVLKH